MDSIPRRRNYMSPFYRFLRISVLFFVSFTNATQITHGPYIQNMTENSVRIIWHTDKNCFSHVEYGETSSPGTVVRASQNGLFDAYTTIHNIRIKGLEKGKQYYYRVVSREITSFQPYSVTFGETATSGTYSFTTFDREKESFSFIAISDIHQNSSKLTLMLNNVDWNNVDFVGYTGDMVDAISSESQIWTWLDPSVDKFAKERPFVYVMGNHDKRGNYARHLPQYFSGEDNTGRFYYAFTQGKVRFIVLDAGEDKEDDHSVYAGLVNFDAYRIEQANWLKDVEVESDEFKNSLWQIGLIHFPVASTSADHGTRHLRDLVQPIFNSAGIDLTLVGHTHSYAIRTPNASHDYYEVNNSTTTVTRVDVTNDKLVVTVNNQEGTQIDQFTITANTEISVTDLKEEKSSLLKVDLSFSKSICFHVGCKGEYSVALYDLKGVEVVSKRGKGPERVKFSRAVLPPKVYIVKLENNTLIKNYKLSIAR
jgi:predicted MPP superfamily phosphohydrolase